MDVLKILRDMLLDQPDSSSWSFDVGWNAAIHQALEKIKAAQQNAELGEAYCTCKNKPDEKNLDGVWVCSYCFRPRK